MEDKNVSHEENKARFDLLDESQRKLMNLIHTRMDAYNVRLDGLSMEIKSVAGNLSSDIKSVNARIDTTAGNLSSDIKSGNARIDTIAGRLGSEIREVRGFFFYATIVVLGVPIGSAAIVYILEHLSITL